MRFLRSLAFNLYFYLNMTVWLIAMLPLMLFPGSVMWRVVSAWSSVNLAALKWIAGIDVEIRGLEHLPKSPAIIASKHQSTWETVAILQLFERPAFVLKQELMWVPLFGWYAARTGMIPVDRGRGHAVVKAMIASAARVVAEGRQIVIYPEGTRKAPGAEPAYKQGIVHLYRELGIACVPVALNSGLYWPRRSFLLTPGRVIVEFLPPIAPGLGNAAFFDRLRSDIETATDRLLAEAGMGVSIRPQSSRATAE